MRPTTLLLQQLAAAALLLALGASCAAQSAAPRPCSAPVRMGILADWEPYNYTDEAGKQAGLDLELSRAIFAEANCMLIEFGPLSSSAGVRLFMDGKVDLMMGASRTPARDVFAHFSRAYRGESASIFTLVDSPAEVQKVASFAQFMQQSGLLLALRIGWFGEDFENNKEQLRRDNRLADFSGYSQGVRLLGLRRAPYLLGDTVTIARAARRQGISVVALSFQLVKAPVYMMFNRKTVSAEDVRLLDEAVERLERRGVLEKIRRSYAAQ
ncbi:MAG: transporter substrate-binding domain-containing protein [Pseudomonadota bacterium]